MDDDHINHIDKPEIIAKILTKHFNERGKLCLSNLNGACKADTRIVDNDPVAGYLLLDALPKEIAHAIANEAVIEVRGLIDSLYSWFRTDELRMISENGEQYFEIPYPSKLFQLQRRNAFRIEIFPRLSATIGGDIEDAELRDDFHFEAILDNLSATGAQMTVSGRTASLLHEGAIIQEARIQVPRILDVTLNAQVRNCRPGGTKQELTLGLEFLDLPLQKAQLITRAVMGLQRQALADSNQ